jgi:hypothetical protein
MGDLFARYLPDKIILPTLGNNDYKYHYQFPTQDKKDEYLNLLYNTWFERHPKNKELFKDAKISETFLNAGYYRVDLTPKLSFLGLNTVLYSVKCHPDQQTTE